MSIMPEGGWEDPPRQDAQQRPDYPPQPTYTPRSSYLTCKVCDRGILRSKTVFRMSGPVVAIGFILLIPSFLGMLLSAWVFVRSAAYQNDSAVNRSYYVADQKIRKSCVEGFGRIRSSLPAKTTVPEFCECVLNSYSIFISGASTRRITEPMKTATQDCSEAAWKGVLAPVSPDLMASYSKEELETNGQTTEPVLTSTVAIIIGIASFVGGLLGWLLVMRKRVLQCNVCGAVVNAS
jgi:hypothetical protein